MEHSGVLVQTFLTSWMSELRSYYVGKRDLVGQAIPNFRVSYVECGQEDKQSVDEE
jgi:hypothetical protein